METRRLSALRLARSLVLALGLAGVGVGVGGCNSAPAELDAAALDLPKIERPSAATQGAAKAFLGPFAGGVTLTAANNTSLDAAAGMPLLADDRLRVDAGGLVVVLFTNGKVLRVEGEFDQAIRDLAGFGDPPVAADLETQLRGALSEADRERLVASSERIGGWQLRLKAVDGVAAEEADVASVPMSEPSKDAKTAAEAERSTRRSGGGDKADAKEADAKDEDGPNAGGEELEPEEPAPPGSDGGGFGDGGSNAGYGSNQQPSADARPPRPDTTKSPPPKLLDTGRRDQEPAKEPAKKPWKLTAAKWTSGDAVTLPTALRGSLTSCLATLKVDDATVDITVVEGTIKGLEVRGVSTLKCVEEFAGWTLTGVAGSGTIRATFKRR